MDIPASPDVAELLSDYTGGEAISQGEAFDPSPQNIEGRLDRVINANTIDMAFMPKETRGDAVQAVMSLSLEIKKV